VARQRATQRKGRDKLFKAALVGYTNAGKSSLLRALSGSDAFVEDRLFATLDTASRSADLGDGYECLLTDTVGFIRKLPHHLVASFRATLEEAADADVLLHVIDVSHPGWEEQKEVVDEVLGDLSLRQKPMILVFNKVDRLTHDEERSWQQRAASDYPQNAVFVSTLEPDGVEPLRELLRNRVRSLRPEVRITLPVARGALLAEIYREGEVLSRTDEGDTTTLRARLHAAALGRLRQRPDVVIQDSEFGIRNSGVPRVRPTEPLMDEAES
jgi:GTP-binding protein HflX